MPAIPNKDVRLIANQLAQLGLDIVPRRSGHYAVLRENGSLVMTLPRSPSDHHWRKNTAAALRRLGYEVR